MAQPPKPPGTIPVGPPTSAPNLGANRLAQAPVFFGGGAPTSGQPIMQAFVNSRRVFGSGTLLIMRDDVLTLKVAELTFEIRFSDMGRDEQSVESTQVSPTYVAIRLCDFSNALGTALGPVPVGTYQGQPLMMGVYVEGVGEQHRVLTYCFYEGAK